MDRNIYLSNTDLEEAVGIYLEKMARSSPDIGVEEIDTCDAAGRVTARPIFASISSPNHNAAAMDGIMVISAATYMATEAAPVILRKGTDFAYINTGHMILEPYDAVIMIEDIVDLPDGSVRIQAPASPWQHIRPIGEDIIAGEMILPENHLVRPMDIGAVLSGGRPKIHVYEKIRVGIIPTGNEITDHYGSLDKGKIFDTNSWTFKAIVEQMGGMAVRTSPVPDDHGMLKTAILDMVRDCHVVVINAGSSAGSKDYTAGLIRDLGELVLHGVAIKPGKPTVLGFIAGKPVVGVPGYPGSAYLVFEEIVGPVIRQLQHIKAEKAPMAEAVVSRRIVSSLKYREYVRVTLGRVDGKLIATPLARGAGITMSLVRADGLIVIPMNSEGFEAGGIVPVELETDIETIDNTLVSIGSHDIIMDVLANLMAKNAGAAIGRPMRLSSAHVGSMGGIMALKRGEAHIAPIHLLDEETGEYNESYVKKYLGDDFTLIKGVRREQGIMTLKGNPKGIHSVADFVRSDVIFVNRQKGSGTRILTDHLLRMEGIENNGIKGYDREMTTHMAVAAAVESGTADAGVGVYSAAAAMDLDFISIGFEAYDFAVAKKNLGTGLLNSFLEALHSPEFRIALDDLGGYGVQDSN